MKRLFRLTLIFLCLFAFVSIVKPTQVAQAATCANASGSGAGVPQNFIDVYAGQTFTLTLNIPGETDTFTGAFVGQLYNVTVTNVFTFTGVAPSDGTWSWSAISTTPPGTLNFANWTWSWSATACPGTGPIFPDGRLNSNDAQQTAAIYCDNGGVTVYVPGTPKWYRAFHASKDEINKVPKNPAKNTLIKQRLGARLYRLATGNLQVNAPELNPTKGDYVFIFSDCS
jgi:hypothetical protein